MLASGGSLLNCVIVSCNVVATIKAHACGELMLLPCDRRVGRPSFPQSSKLTNST